MVKTLIFAQGQTREGMKWTVIDLKTNKPVDFTGAVITVLAYDAQDRTTTIVNKTSGPPAGAGVVEILTPADGGQAQYLFAAGETDRPGTYEVELNEIVFADGSIGILDDMQIVIKTVGVGS